MWPTSSGSSKRTSTPRLASTASTQPAQERVVEPLRLEGGFLTAYDLRTAEVRTFTVARITGVAAVADPAR